MKIEEARESVGKMVMSLDMGNKLMRRGSVSHGPYTLKQVTKGGMCIIAKPDGDRQVAPSLLTLHEP